MAFTDPSYRKPRITRSPNVDSRTLGLGNSNVAAPATDRRNNFNEVDLTRVPNASERTLNQNLGDIGMRTHAQESMNASKTMGRGPDMMRPDGANTNGPGTAVVGEGFIDYYSKRGSKQ
jgi:hypothetical protein